MFRCSHTIIRERINSCLLKLQFLKQSIKTRCVVNTVVVWLRMLGPYWYMCIALLYISLTVHHDINQFVITNLMHMCFIS
jgi:hypothetical protein